MAAGLPVVASAIPGYDEVFTHDVEGLFVAPRDAAALATAATDVLDNPARAARFAEAGRARAAVYDWGRVVTELETSYADALASGPPPLR
jgi:phosphatidylinositol alpha-mannosyltransferase